MALPILISTPDTAFDLASLAFDVYTGDAASFALDAAALMMPGVPATGAVRHADDALKSLNRVDNVTDTAHTLKYTDEALLATKIDNGPYGSWFQNAETWEYKTDNLVVGQRHDTSCVAGCAIMLMNDPAIREDAVMWDALGIDEYTGSSVGALPDYLASKGFPGYEFEAQMNLLELSQAIQKNGPAVVGIGDVYVPSLRTWVGHAVVIDELTIDFTMSGGGRVALRDPSPIGKGASYYVSLEDFMKEYFLGGARAVYKQ